MKAIFRARVSGFLLLAIAQISYAATATFVSKETFSGADGYRYTFSYTCLRGTNGLISVNSFNDQNAQKLANEKAKLVCEE